MTVPIFQLGQWPIQLALVPVRGEIGRDADVLIAADCVGHAMSDYHERLLAGKTVAIACPKLDDMAGHSRKLAEIFRHNNIRSVTMAHMEVPCCFGIVQAVRTAIAQSGRTDIPVHDVAVGIDGRKIGTVTYFRRHKTGDCPYFPNERKAR